MNNKDYILNYEWDRRVQKESDLVIGQNLLTKNGSVLGNCIIVDIKETMKQNYYIVLTDFGNTLSLTWDEIQEGFNLEETQIYVVDVEQRIKVQREMLGNFLEWYK